MTSFSSRLSVYTSSSSLFAVSSIRSATSPSSRSTFSSMSSQMIVPVVSSSSSSAIRRSPPTCLSPVPVNPFTKKCPTGYTATGPLAEAPSPGLFHSFVAWVFGTESRTIAEDAPEEVCCPEEMPTTPPASSAAAVIEKYCCWQYHDDSKRDRRSCSNYKTPVAICESNINRGKTYDTWQACTADPACEERTPSSSTPSIVSSVQTTGCNWQRNATGTWSCNGSCADGACGIKHISSGWICTCLGDNCRFRGIINAGACGGPCFSPGYHCGINQCQASTATCSCIPDSVPSPPQ